MESRITSVRLTPEIDAILWDYDADAGTIIRAAIARLEKRRLSARELASARLSPGPKKTDEKKSRKR